MDGWRKAKEGKSGDVNQKKTLKKKEQKKSKKQQIKRKNMKNKSEIKPNEKVSVKTTWGERDVRKKHKSANDRNYRGPRGGRYSCRLKVM